MALLSYMDAVPPLLVLLKYQKVSSESLLVFQAGVAVFVLAFSA